ncbi:MAG: ankyrin-2-like [Rickettsiaceae bacterium]|jgi:ankyrin repeat protein|nr:ankyrin-2-like [Rickettsiaceae bacterium]
MTNLQDILEDYLFSGINHIDSSGNTVLHYAVMNNNFEYCRILLENKANITVQNGKGESPIAYAAKYGRPEIMNLFLANIANINEIHEHNGYSLLHYAVQQNNLKVIELLLENGANIDLPSSQGKGNVSPLILTIQKHRLEPLKMMLPLINDINQKDDQGWTLLHHAAHQGNTEAIEYLVSQGAAIDASDLNGYTPLHIATEDNCYEAVKTLIDNDADLYCINIHDKYTPLEIALKNNNRKLVELLVTEGANICSLGMFPDIRTNLSYTFIMLNNALLTKNPPSIFLALNQQEIDQNKELILSALTGQLKFNNDQNATVNAAKYIQEISPEADIIELMINANHKYDDLPAIRTLIKNEELGQYLNKQNSKSLIKVTEKELVKEGLSYGRPTVEGYLSHLKRLFEQSIPTNAQDLINEIDALMAKQKTCSLQSLLFKKLACQAAKSDQDFAAIVKLLQDAKHIYLDACSQREVILTFEEAQAETKLINALQDHSFEDDLSLVGQNYIKTLDLKAEIE